MSFSKTRLLLVSLAAAGTLLAGGCATTSDGYFESSNVSGSVSVGYYGSYYDDPWCCYGGYPPPIYYPPGGVERPDRPVDRPTTLPAEVNRPINTGRPPTSRPAPAPRPVSRPMGGGVRRR